MENKIELIGSKPTGLVGRFAGWLMNLIRSRQYKQIIKRFIVNDNFIDAGFTILDVGCGGGIAVKLFSKIMPHSLVFGIDHSNEMVSLARNVNRNGIIKGWVEIREASINKLPFEDESFDIITAFDNINFWNNYDLALNEIKRVLRDKGTFFIINGYPDKDSKWYNVVKFKSDKEYQALLIKHGFKKIEINIIGLNLDTIIIKAVK